MENKAKGKYHNLVQNLSILTICNFSSKILVFFLVPLYTSVLTTAEYGLYDLITNTAMILFWVLTLNISDGVLRYLQDKRYERSRVVSIGLKWITLGIGIVALLLLINRLLGLWNGLIGLELYVLLYYASYTVNQLAIQIAKGFDEVKAMGVSGVWGTVATIIFNVVFLCVYSMGLKGFFIANTLGQCVQVVILLYKIRVWNYIRFDCSKHLQREMLQYSLPLIFNSLGWIITGSLGKYVVAAFLGIAANGIYSVAYKIPTILNVFQSIFTQAWQVSAVKEYDQPNREVFYSNIFSCLIATMCILCSGLILFTRPIATFMFAAEFFVAWKYVPLLLVSVVINTASGFCGPLLSAQKNSKEMARAALIGVVVNVILTFSLVPAMGVQGAAVATVCSDLVIWGVRKKACKDLFKIKRLWKIYLIWVLLLLEAIAEIYTIDFLAGGLTFLIILLSIEFFLPLLKKIRASV